jgi:hypothetical protein
MESPFFLRHARDPKPRPCSPVMRPLLYSVGSLTWDGAHCMHTASSRLAFHRTRRVKPHLRTRPTRADEHQRIGGLPFHERPLSRPRHTLFFPLSLLPLPAEAMAEKAGHLARRLCLAAVAARPAATPFSWTVAPWANLLRKPQTCSAPRVPGLRHLARGLFTVRDGDARLYGRDSPGAAQQQGVRQHGKAAEGVPAGIGRERPRTVPRYVVSSLLQVSSVCPEQHVLFLVFP